ncbi:hypothetical protein T265_09969 [Opisthorchis viverrini]|uniref:Uncharacterized protein n=1 Tax=Opisthorchis viverrini TaxID=6198 RepID=A0A074ZEX6_OPIVI|nr:hypothetical protein T265_09969 [Opisthorchis viverrini]KER21785.1 hypothetical protein T265_09969 [Opisthorchis viverrini]
MIPLATGLQYISTGILYKDTSPPRKEQDLPESLSLTLGRPHASSRLKATSFELTNASSHLFVHAALFSASASHFMRPMPFTLTICKEYVCAEALILRPYTQCIKRSNSHYLSG